ncbi:MAG TPA: TonB-dependent receptor [Bacteroidia bacterium]|nr:TonB-dependent receptor [Sphingobacteriales bacterium]HPD66331.1 TonB-dependent receptor [Bacteroidia bacterium]HRS59871.1 TonB-dependent receptor [Bacteroidia bacterium]HRU68343.1 TonB-dependent receptor [Bacteroidia bacterium]
MKYKSGIISRKILSKEFIFILLLSTLLCQPLLSQKYTISGYITDNESGEKLIGANIFEKYKLQGTTSNAYGFYSLTLPADTYTLVFSYLGYSTELRSITLKSNLTLNIGMKPGIELSEVEIVGEQTDRIEESSQMSIVKIPVAQIKSIPAMFGEVDVLKALQLLPGIQSGMEGSSGLYVRGGGPDQNLILLDGTPVYNASHLFGFFSVFNADAIKNVELIKGGFPARYGGRLSSVIDISMKEGDQRKYHVQGSLGLIASKITVEGPIVKDRTSFIISARRTYLDIIAQPIIRLATSGDQRITAGYYFYDFNAKINHRLTDKDHLYLSVYQGDDKFYLNSKPRSYLFDGVLYTEQFKANLGWGNITTALRWNHQFNHKLFSNTTLTYSRYQFKVGNEEQYFSQVGSKVEEESYIIRYFSGINDIAGKIDFDYLPSPNHYIKFGISHIYHSFHPGVSAFKINITNVVNIDSTIGAKNVYAHESAIYIEDDVKLTANLKANLGLHYSAFYVNNKLYHRPQPRLSVRYLFADNWSFKASYVHMQQYIHLLTNTTIGLPTDLWVPATGKILPQNSQQFAAGVASTLREKYSFSVEGYYKTMNNLIEYRDGATWLNTSADWQDKVEMGKGWSYGMEVFAEKKSGKTTGWIGYTLSWTMRQFDNINFGEPYPYKYDRRHDISVVVAHKFNKQFDIGVTWVYGTGNALTLPVMRAMAQTDYYYPGYYSEIEYFEKKNDFRMAAYHRLDFSANWNFHVGSADATLNLSVYNCYSRRNPFFYYFGYDNYGHRVLYRVSLFPVIPALSINFKF